MTTLDIQSLNLLFNCLGSLTSTVCWVRNADFSKQLYVSESFESIYGSTCEQLYNHPETWSDAIKGPDRNNILSRLDQRVRNQLNNIQDNSPILYEFENPNNEHKFIKNTCIPLQDAKGSTLAFMGLSESVTESEWLKMKNGSANDLLFKANKLVNDLNQLIIKHLIQDPSVMAKAIHQPNISSIEDSSLTAQLSRRERECLSLLLKGNSAKQTGRILNLSPRTIESYIEAIKRKFDCRTKIEIISKLQINALQCL